MTLPCYKQTPRFRYLLVLLALLAYTSVQAADAPSKSEVRKLADQYIRAVKNQDVAAWNELLAPLHSDDLERNKENFLEQTETIKSLSIETIDGLNVVLRIQYLFGLSGTGSLQIGPAGGIKYTPLCFQHPLYAVCTELELLLDDQMSLFGASSSSVSRMETASRLESQGIPLFDYDPFAPTTAERRAAARKILEWLQENGAQYDTAHPELFLPPQEFNSLIERLQKAAK